MLAVINLIALVWAVDGLKVELAKCENVANQSIEQVICTNSELLSLDKKINGLYKTVLKKSAAKDRPILELLWNGWLRGRNECWKEDDKISCIKNVYNNAIVDFQVEYELVPRDETQVFICHAKKNSNNTLTFTKFHSDIPSFLVRYNEQSSLMYQKSTEDKDKKTYVGRNESMEIWSNGSAKITWGYGAETVGCEIKK